MSVTLESALFMGKNYSDNLHSIKNTNDLTMKQMFDISAKLVSEQDEIYGVITTDWECHKSMAGGGGNKKRYQCCTDSSGIILYLRALQGHKP